MVIQRSKKSFLILPVAVAALATLATGAWGSSAEAGEYHARCIPARKGVCKIVPVKNGGQQLFDYLKLDNVAAKGACLAPVNTVAQADSILEKAEIRVEKAENFSAKGKRSVNKGARPEERVALAKGVQRILEMSDGSFSGIKGAKMSFRTASKRHNKSNEPFGHQLNDGSIEIVRNGDSSDTNVAHLIHELAHYIGNKNKGELYHLYKENVPHCQFTRRSREVLKGVAARNEEFADVFSSFITHPENLLKSGGNCKKAYEFFANAENKIFARGESIAKCNSASKGINTKMVEDVPARVPANNKTPLPPPRPGKSVA